MPSSLDLLILIKARDEASSVIDGMGGAMGKLGGIAIGAGAAIAAGLAVGIKSAGDLQQAVANISTIKPQIDTKEVFAQLNEISTRVPQTAKQLGDGLYDIFSSLEVSQEQAIGLVETFAKGAVGANTDAQTFGTAAIGAMNAYGLATTDADHITDVFFSTVNKGVVTGQELAANLGLVTQSAKLAGVDLDSLGGFIAGVTKEGGPAAQNINNLSNLFQKITTKEATKAFHDLGIATADATGNFRPQIDVLADLKAATAGMTEEARVAAIQKIFPDLQARAGASVIMDQLDFVREAIAANKVEVGSAAAAYEKMSATFNSQTQLLGNAFSAILTTIGGELLPAITPFITAFAKDLPDAFTGVRAVFIAFSSDAGAMGLALDMVRKIFGDTVADAIEPFVNAVMNAIPSIHAFLDSVGDVFGQVAGFVKQALGGDVQGALGGFVDMVGGIRDRLVPIIAGWSAAFLEWIGPMIGPMLQALGGLVIALVGWIAEKTPIYLAQLVQWGRAFVEWVIPTIPAILTELGKLAGALLNWIAAAGPMITAQLIAWGKLFISWVAPQIPPLLNELSRIGTAILGWITERGSEIVAKLVVWAAAFSTWVGPALQTLQGELGALSATVIRWIGEQTPPIATALLAWGGEFIKWIAPTLAALPGQLASITGSVVHFIAVDALPLIIGSLIGWGIAFVKWIIDVVPKLPGELLKIVTAIQEWITGAGRAQVSSAASGLGTSLIDGIKNGIAGAVDGLKQAASDAVANTIQAARAAADAHSPSRKMEELGIDLGSGLIQGLRSMSTAVSAEMATVLKSAVSGLKGGGGAFLTVPQFGTAIRAMGFSESAISAICGPIAAQGISEGLGKSVSLIDVEAIASKIGAYQRGSQTFGTGAFQKILSAIGIDSRSGSFDEAVQAAMQGIPVAISTPLHYFLAQGFDEATQQFVVGNTGTALKAGAEKMTRAAIEGVAGAATFIIPSVQAAGAAVRDLGDNIASSFVDIATPAVFDLEEAITALVGTNSLWQQLDANASETGRDLATYLGEIAAPGVDLATASLEDLQAMSGLTLPQIQDQAEAAGEDIQHWLMDIGVPAAQGLADEFQALQDRAGPALDATGVSLRGLGRDIEASFTSTAPTAIDKFFGLLEQLATDVDRAGDDIATSMADIATKVADGIARATEDGANQIASAMRSAQDQLDSLGGPLADPTSTTFKQSGLAGEISAAKGLIREKRRDADDLFSHQQALAKANAQFEKDTNRAAIQLDKDLARARTDLDKSGIKEKADDARAILNETHKAQIDDLDKAFADKAADHARTKLLDAADRALELAEDAKMVKFREAAIIAERDAKVLAAQETTTLLIATIQERADKERAILAQSYVDRIADLKAGLLDKLPGLTGDAAILVQQVFDQVAVQATGVTATISGAVGTTADAAQTLVDTFGIKIEEANAIIEDHGSVVKRVLGVDVPGSMGLTDQAVEEFAAAFDVSWDTARKMLEATGATSDAVMGKQIPDAVKAGAKIIDTALAVGIPKSAGATITAFDATTTAAGNLKKPLEDGTTAAKNLAKDGFDVAKGAADTAKDSATQISFVLQQLSDKMPGLVQGIKDFVSELMKIPTEIKVKITTDQVAGLQAGVAGATPSQLASTGMGTIAGAGNVDMDRAKTDQGYRDQLRDQGYQVGSEGGAIYVEKRAGGGPVSAGKMYQVNDSGSRAVELFMPSMSGYVGPKGGGGGGSVAGGGTWSNGLRPEDARMLARELAAVIPSRIAVEDIRSSLLQLGARNGGVGLA